MQHEQIHTNLFPARKLKCIVPRHFSPAFRASGKTFRCSGKLPGRPGIKFSVKVALFSFWSNENGFSFWQNEKLSEKLSAIRKRLQSILACIFALRILDNGKKMACTSKSRRKKEEQPRNLKNIVNVWESPSWKDVAGPRFILGQHCSREINQLACPCSFLSVSGDLYAFLDELLRSLTYLQQ